VENLPRRVNARFAAAVNLAWPALTPGANHA